MCSNWFLLASRVFVKYWVSFIAGKEGIFYFCGEEERDREKGFFCAFHFKMATLSDRYGVGRKEWIRKKSNMFDNRKRREIMKC